MTDLSYFVYTYRVYIGRVNVKSSRLSKSKTRNGHGDERVNNNTRSRQEASNACPETKRSWSVKVEIKGVLITGKRITTNQQGRVLVPRVLLNKGRK